MAINTDLSQAYYNGQRCWAVNDYNGARYWYQISARDFNFRDNSLFKLISIEIREGNYSLARQMLKQSANSIQFQQLYGLLENIEFNIERSKKYYAECMKYPDFQYKSLLALAKLNIQTGDYIVARKMLETLQLNSDFYIQAMFNLIFISIYEHDFYMAKKLISEIDTSRLTPKLIKHYNHIYAYIRYFLGELKASDDIYIFEKDYMIYRLFNHSDKVLLNHIRCHCNQKLRNTVGCFLPHIDIKKLLYEARDRIEDMNANHFELSDMYRFRLDSLIGYKGDLDTSDLCVATLIDTKDIITMYPVLLSEEFDIEGLATSEELRLRRLQGSIK